MVSAVRSGRSAREVARAFNVALSTVQLWVRRAQGKRLDRVDWSDRSDCPHHLANKTAPPIETQVLTLRTELKASALGEYGASAIHDAMLLADAAQVPSMRTINRILARNGALDGQRRIRRPPPPPGWYLPDVSAGLAEVDQIDVVSGLVLQGGFDVEVLNMISLHGGPVGSFPSGQVLSGQIREALVSHWMVHGLPRYAQFDNDTRFLGPTNRPDVLGTVARFCLSLSVVPVYVPPRETGFQAAVESLNCRWQDKVWARFWHASLAELQMRSGRYVAASHQRHARRIEAAPGRRAFPTDWQHDRQTLQAPPSGQVIFLRRTDGQGQASLLGRTVLVDTAWLHRLVRCELDLDAGRIRFVALRRAEPARQPVLGEQDYRYPRWKSRVKLLG